MPSRYAICFFAIAARMLRAHDFAAVAAIECHYYLPSLPLHFTPCRHVMFADAPRERALLRALRRAALFTYARDATRERICTHVAEFSRTRPLRPARCRVDEHRFYLRFCFAATCHEIVTRHYFRHAVFHAILR